MGSRNVPVLQAILPSYIVIRKPPFSPQFYHAWVLLLIFPHQSHGGVTVAGVKLVDRWSWKHTARCVHHLSGEKGLIVLLRERWGIKKMKMYPPPTHVVSVTASSSLWNKQGCASHAGITMYFRMKLKRLWGFTKRRLRDIPEVLRLYT